MRSMLQQAKRSERGRLYPADLRAISAAPEQSSSGGLADPKILNTSSQLSLSTIHGCCARIDNSANAPIATI